PGAAVLLPLRIGEAAAAEWILAGRAYSGREGAASGFATRSFAPDALDRETDRAVADLLSRSPLALASARELLRRSRREAVTRDLPKAEEAYRRLVGSEDLARAVREFPESTVDSRQRKNDDTP